jgi:hypothetical protein
MKKLLAIFLLPLGAFALTPIADTIYTASGVPAAAGSYLVIEWPRFTSGGNHAIPPNVQKVSLANGTFSVALESTATAQFPFHYTVEYHLMSGGQELRPYTETWDVADTATPQRIVNVVVISPAPLPPPAAKGDLAASDGVNTVWLPAPPTAGYLLETDPTQPTGLSYSSINSLGSNFDPAGAAATAQSNAKTYTDSSIAGLSSIYDQAGAAAAVQASFQTSLANAIGALNLGTASTHPASDFDAAGAASAAQTAAKAYTDSVVGSSGVTSSYVNNAITSAIAGLHLLSASQHAASDFDPAGTATSAVNAIATASATASGLLSKTDWATFNGKQNAIPANTYDAYGAAASSQANAISSAQTNANTAIAALNLKSASQHTATDFDAAGAATTAVAGIPTSGSAQTHPALITAADWATFNGKQAALGFTPENSAKKGAASGYAPLDASSNVPAANLGNLGTAAFQATSAFDTASAASSAVAAIPTSGSLQTRPALITPTDWAAFNNKQAALGFAPLNAANSLSDLASVSQARTNLGLGSAATQATSAFDPAGAATAAAPAFKGPYIVQGLNTFIASSGKQTASTLPSGLSLAVLNGSTPISPTTVTAGTNGNLLLGDPNGAGPFYYGASATSSIEMEFTANGTAVSGGAAGLYVWDSAHNLLYLWAFYTNGGTQNSVQTGSYTGSAAPTGIAGTKSFTSTPQAVLGFKIQVINGQFHYLFSIDGGNNFTDFFTTAQTSVSLANAGIYFTKAYINVLNLVIQ